MARVDAWHSISLSAAGTSTSLAPRQTQQAQAASLANWVGNQADLPTLLF
jgi:hypothetical protein